MHVGRVKGHRIVRREYTRCGQIGHICKVRAPITSSGERFPGTCIGMGKPGGVPGAHLPGIGGERQQAVDRDACAGAGGDPGSVAGIVVFGIQAILVAGGASAGPPAQGQAGRLIRGIICRAELVERSRQGRLRGLQFIQHGIISRFLLVVLVEETQVIPKARLRNPAKIRIGP